MLVEKKQFKKEIAPGHNTVALGSPWTSWASSKKTWGELLFRGGCESCSSLLTKHRTLAPRVNGGLQLWEGKGNKEAPTFCFSPRSPISRKSRVACRAQMYCSAGPLEGYLLRSPRLEKSFTCQRLRGHGSNSSLFPVRTSEGFHKTSECKYFLDNSMDKITPRSHHMNNGFLFHCFFHLLVNIHNYNCPTKLIYELSWDSAQRFSSTNSSFKRQWSNHTSWCFHLHHHYFLVLQIEPRGI